MRLKAGFLNATFLYKHMVIFRQFLSTACPFYHLLGVVESRFTQKADGVFAQIDGFLVLTSGTDATTYVTLRGCLDIGLEKEF